uniref:Phospholipid phosphatase related 4 n=1 Tax=Astyanax mexicanus TaxID=7994 RepID=A0A3B1IJI2_ASTMX
FNMYIIIIMLYKHGVHVFGLCATALITNIIQLSTGYPAPYFLTVCKPNYTHLNSSCTENSFILEDICSGADTAVINAGRKSFPSQHATLASFAAVYISMYFNSTLTDSSKLLKPLLVFSFIISGIAVYLVSVNLEMYCIGCLIGSYEPQVLVPVRALTDLGQRAGHHLPAKSCSSSDGLSSSHSEGILHRNPQARQTNSLTNLKRSSADVEVITPQIPVGRESMVTFSNTLPRMYSPALDDVRRAATIHATMDSSRSKQLLSQWKSKNENRKLSLQATENGPGPSPSSSMETRSSSEPSAVGINEELQGPGAPCYKLATGSTTLPSNASGIAGGARISLQSRPGSSQLVHIPEETQEGIGTSPGGNVRDKWLKSMEKNAAAAPVRTNVNGQPRIMQVIAMSKQQGLLPTGSPSSESSHTSSTAPLHRYKSLTEESASGAASQGSTGAIVRVEAHPENGRPLVHAHSTDGSSSWAWKSQSSFRQSFELNDLNRDSESSESFRDGFSSTDRKRSNSSHPHQAISTIRVTPMESTESGPESRDSTLNRKSKSNMILIPERGNSPDNTRNIFYKGTSTTPAFKE